MDKKDIGFLLEFCNDYPEIYNKIANQLYIEFGIRSAELVLLISYYVIKFGGNEK